MFQALHWRSRRDIAVPWRAGSQLISISVLDLLIGAATFSSLGVVLPHMVEDLGWNWSQAGIGFTILGAACGGSALLPPKLIRRFGVRMTLLIGTGLMAAGLYLLHNVSGLIEYFLGAAICGVSFQMMAGIPATFVIARLFKKRSTALGVYSTIGGFGNVVGPWMVLGVLAVPDHTWREYWSYQAILILAYGVLCAFVIGMDGRFARPAQEELNQPHPPEPDTEPAALEDASLKVFRTRRNWKPEEAMRTVQFYILLAAYFSNLICLVTITSLSVSHLVERGVSTTMAGAMLSLEAFIAVLFRAASGVLGDHVEPRYLLTGALGATAIGCFVLAVTQTQPWLLLYALGTGVGFGTIQLACTVLMLNYFGQRYNLELFSTMCLVGAASALGPAIGGVLRDLTGSFVSVFLILSAISAIVCLAATMMRPPIHSTTGATMMARLKRPDRVVSAAAAKFICSLRRG